MNKTTGEEKGGERKALLGLSVWGTAWRRRQRDWSRQRQPAVTCMREKAPRLAFLRRAFSVPSVTDWWNACVACVAFTPPQWCRQGQVVAMLHSVLLWPLFTAVTQNTRVIIRVIHHGSWHFITRTICKSCFQRVAGAPGGPAVLLSSFNFTNSSHHWIKLTFLNKLQLSS